jgi:hypothetical protein
MPIDEEIIQIIYCMIFSSWYSIHLVIVPNIRELEVGLSFESTSLYLKPGIFFDYQTPSITPYFGTPFTDTPEWHSG